MADNTLMWFCSDNGPSWIHDYNSAGPFRGKKGSLYEGGIRVPAILEWPAAIPEPRVTDAPCCTSDFFPTIQALTGFQVPGQPEPIDGINVLPLIEGRMAKRPEPIAFQSPIKGEESWHMDPNKKQLALIDNTYKVFSGNGGTSYELYNLEQDPYETTNIAGEHPEVVKTMRSRLEEWVESCRRSEAGEDYT